MRTVCVEFAMVTVTAADVAVFPAASRARAVSVCCEPLAAEVVFHAAEYGAVVSSAPSAAPSRKNWTPATPTLSDALAVTVTEPLTVAPEVGEVTATVGADVSLLATVAVTAGEVAALPAASRARAVNACAPFAAVVVFHVIE